KFSCGSSSQTVVTNSNGFAYVDIDWAPGTYNVKSEYLGKSVDSKITVKSTISASDVSGTYLNSKVTATFLDEYGKVLADKQITFKIDDMEFTATTDAKGVATANVDLGADNYVVTAVNPVNNEQKEFKLTISKASSSFKLGVGKNDEGAIIITATLTPSTVTGNVKFKFDGDVITYASTISNGKATLISPYSSEGTYDLVVSYDGDSNFNAAPTMDFSFTISAPVPVLTANSVSVVYGYNKDMVIYLMDSDGIPIPGKEIYIKLVSGSKYYVYYGDTGSSGAIRLSTKGIDPGTYIVYISSENCKPITAKMIIKKAAVKLTANAKTFKKSVKTKKYTITLKNNLNKVMKNTKVTLKVNGKTYSAKTNSKGQATFKITKLTKKGKFTAIVKYGGSKFYNSKTVKPKITVK
ncbi:Ig-like domain-containing protein, partial [Methanobrevibacter sp.]|uniref:Ig-like domain-containing protein n=1 Tax=Methanobrevibacter sp. TaxID=66852 RepID=UPI003867DAC4